MDDQHPFDTPKPAPESLGPCSPISSTVKNMHPEKVDEDALPMPEPVYCGNSCCMGDDTNERRFRIDSGRHEGACYAKQRLVHHEVLHSLMAHARTLRAQYEQSWNLQDVEERIQLIRRAIALQASTFPCPPRAPGDGFISVQTCSLELSVALGERYRHTGQPQDLEEQVEILQSLQEHPAFDAINQACIQRELGAALRMRFRHSKDPEDIGAALRVHSTLLDSHPIDHPERYLVLYELGHTKLVQFERFGRADDLTRCIEMQQEALAQTPSELPTSNPSYFSPKWCLTSALWYRYNLGGGIESLHAAMAMGRDVLISQPSNHRDLHLTYSCLGTCAGALYEQTNNIDDLNNAVVYLGKALMLQDPRGPRRLPSCCNYATALRMRYLRFGNIQDLEDAIQILKEGLTMPGPPFPPAICELGIALGNRYAVLGFVDDLDEGIKVMREALLHHPPGSLRRDFMLKHLGAMVGVRYRRDKVASDLDESISLYRETILLRENGSSDMGDATFSLAEALSLYHEDVGDVLKLGEAISLCELHLASPIADGEKNLRGWFLHTYAKALILRYDHSLQPNDLDSGILHFREALALRPCGHTGRHQTLIELAEAHRRKFSLLHWQHDVDQAETLLQEAELAAPEGHTDRATVFFKLARILLLSTAPVFNLSLSLETMRRGVCDQYQNAQNRLTSALEVLDEMEHHVYFFQFQPFLRHTLLEVYSQVVELLPRVAYFGLDVASRLRVLSHSDTLAADGAGHALALNAPKVAVELLEQGRAVFWLQHLRLRTTFHLLPPPLARELSDTAATLERDTRILPSEEGQSVDEAHARVAQEMETIKRRRLSTEFEDLLRKARALPGFERFMLPETFATLSMAASHGPIVILLPGRSVCHAIVIERPDVVHQLRLPGTTLQMVTTLSATIATASRNSRNSLQGRAMRRLDRTDKKAEGILEDLWRMVMAPIVQVLNLKKAKGRGRPRVTLCPTGVLTQAPFHAAGLYRSGPSNESLSVSDFWVTSYTPTIGALLSARRRTPQQALPTRVVLAAVAQPSNWARLPYALKEIQAVKDALPPGTNLAVLGGRLDSKPYDVIPPTVEAILGILPDAEVLHLACHGHQDPEHPLNSGFVMEDAMLTVTRLMAMKLNNPIMAFLSACETAKGDKLQPDQALHLAATMLFAGFRSVVGTMWSMGDVDGPMVAETVYTELYSHSANMFDPDTIPYALDRAVQKMRDRGLSANRWAPYVHLGI